MSNSTTAAPAARKKYKQTKLEKRAWRFACNYRVPRELFEPCKPPMMAAMEYAKLHKLDVEQFTGAVIHACDKRLDPKIAPLEARLGDWRDHPVPEIGTPALRTEAREVALKLWAAMQRYHGAGVQWRLGEEKMVGITGYSRKTVNALFKWGQADGVIVNVERPVPHKRESEWIMPEGFDTEAPLPF